MSEGGEQNPFSCFISICKKMKNIIKLGISYWNKLVYINYKSQVQACERTKIHDTVASLHDHDSKEELHSIILQAIVNFLIK